jgi:hypothetical protein
LPSTSQIFEPEAFATKKGDDPTEPKARTGLFTPPGINDLASSKSFWERVRFMRAPWKKATGYRLKAKG